MIETVSIERHTGLEDYESMVFFADALRAMRLQAAQLLPRLGQRTVWMVTSTARGGAIAEMMPGLAGMFRALGVRCEWLVATAARPEFYALKCNALMVNALQRCSVVVVQNSLSEGFGLTATEAMWKGVPVVVSNAHGLALQVREGIDGRVLESAENPDEIADTLAEVLAEPWRRAAWGRSAQRHVFEEFLVFRQVECLLRAFADCMESTLDRTGRQTG